MALVLLVGTLNRVMIVELDVPASLVGIMISLPLLFAPFRALIGFRSDTHRSALGWRRTPYIYRGTMAQFGGLAIMPFAVLVLARAGAAAQAPVWVGLAAAALAFLLVGAGLHTTQTAGLALATDLAKTETQPKVVGLMYVMLALGMIASALVFGALLSDFTPGRLVQVIQGAAVVTVVLNGVALWKQEPRRSAADLDALPAAVGFGEAWTAFAKGGSVLRRLAMVAVGTMAFSMEDVLLEPYGGQILHLPVADTTKLTATFAIGGLAGFALASRVLGRGFDPFRMALIGAATGVPAFVCVVVASPAASAPLFALGTLFIGFGGGVFSHGTLTATMNQSPDDQRGLALGAWGAVQASAAGVAVALGGVIRDSLVQAGVSPNAAYDSVYGLEILLLAGTLVVAVPLVRPGPGRPTARRPEPTQKIDFPMNSNAKTGTHD